MSHVDPSTSSGQAWHVTPETELTLGVCGRLAGFLETRFLALLGTGIPGQHPMPAQHRDPVAVQPDKCACQPQTNGFSLACHAAAADLDTDIIFRSILTDCGKRTQDVIQVAQ